MFNWYSNEYSLWIFKFEWVRLIFYPKNELSIKQYIILFNNVKETKLTTIYQKTENRLEISLEKVVYCFFKVKEKVFFSCSGKSASKTYT
jgi:hypothetical protein